MLPKIPSERKVSNKVKRYEDKISSMKEWRRLQVMRQQEGEKNEFDELMKQIEEKQKTNETVESSAQGSTRMPVDGPHMNVTSREERGNIHQNPPLSFDTEETMPTSFDSTEYSSAYAKMAHPKDEESEMKSSQPGSLRMEYSDDTTAISSAFYSQGVAQTNMTKQESALLKEKRKLVIEEIFLADMKAAYEKQKEMDGTQPRRRLILSLACICLAVIGVFLGAVIGTRAGNKESSKTEEEGSDSGFSFSSGNVTLTASPTLSPTQRPTSSPSEPPTPTPIKCLETRMELLQAVDEYLDDNSDDTSVAKTYGWPISRWCMSGVTNFDGIFSARRNPAAATFNESLAGWETSSAQSMKFLFYKAELFNGDVSTWNVSQVKDFRSAFHYAAQFNQSLSTWDTGKLLTMRNMFNGATAFNQLLDWDTTRVRDMAFAFSAASAFNQDVSTWDTSRVATMESLFFGAGAFNQPLHGWNVSGLTSTKSMFQDATSYNQDLSSWLVGGIFDFTNMFAGASTFNQDLCQWGLRISDSVSLVSGMFDNTNCSSDAEVDLLGSPPGPFCVECT